MNRENEHKDEQQSHTIYVDWDESVVIPSRKSKYLKTKKSMRTDKEKVPDENSLAETNKLDKEDLKKIESAVRSFVQRNEQSVSLPEEQQQSGEKEQVAAKRFTRIFFWVFLCVAIPFLVFWWKFVYVFNIPPYFQQQFPHTTAFIAWKPWSFGPPMLNLKGYGNPINQKDVTGYLIRLDSYKDVVLDPIIIWSFQEH